MWDAKIRMNHAESALSYNKITVNSETAAPRLGSALWSLIAILASVKIQLCVLYTAAGVSIYIDLGLPLHLAE